MNYINVVISELEENLSKIDRKETEKLASAICNAKHIFLSGAGRSGLAINSFANRLLHLGFSASIVGEISSPHSKEGDLLIIGSGSGETGSLISLANKAKSNGVSICSITMNDSSSIANLSDTVIKLPGQAKSESNISIQPMGTLFEQSCFLFYDATVLYLMRQLEETNETMFKRHADLE